MLEGKRRFKFVWMFQHSCNYPLTQIFALFKMYKLAFWIQDVTVPQAKGKKRLNNSKKKKKKKKTSCSSL